MWVRFTENARKVVFYAQESAHERGEPFVSTEHLLLGMMAANDCTGAKVLTTLGIDREQIRKSVDQHAPPQSSPRSPEAEPLTTSAKKSIEIAREEAQLLESNCLGTEHLLLGLIRQDLGVASHVLTELGVELDKTREVVAVLQNGHQKGKISD